MTDAERPGYVRVIVPQLRQLVARTLSETDDLLLPESISDEHTVEWWPVEMARAAGLYRPEEQQA